MRKDELKKVLKPLIKECIKEVMFESGVLSRVVSEVASGLTDNRQVLAETKSASTPERQHIESARSVGASIHLIQDGDVAGVIATTNPLETNIDIYIGIGGAPEGVLAAAALKCIGGQMQTRLVINNSDEEQRAKKMGIEKLDKKFYLEDLVSKDVIFSASGVTDGSMLRGVKFYENKIIAETVVMRSTTGTIRFIRSEYNN